MRSFSVSSKKQVTRDEYDKTLQAAREYEKVRQAAEEECMKARETALVKYVKGGMPVPDEYEKVQPYRHGSFEPAILVDENCAALYSPMHALHILKSCL